MGRKRRSKHHAGIATALGLTLMFTPKLAHALPPPDTDRLGDNVRMLEWERPFAIPGLSRHSQSLIRASRLGRVSEPALQKAYAERAAKLSALAQSSDIAALLGARAARDVLEPLPGRLSADSAAFQQALVVSRTEPKLRVDAARVTFHIAADGLSISGVTSGFQPDIEPAPTLVSPADAVATASEALAELGAPPLELVSDPPELFVVRRPFPGGGARPSTLVRRVNDRGYYAVTFRDPNRTEEGDLVAHIDGLTGEVARVFPLTSDTNLTLRFSDYKKQVWKVGPPLLEDLGKWLFCHAFDGKGTDPDGVERLFSTTYWQPTGKYYMTSCNEYFERMINASDVQTFWADPGSPDFESLYWMSDADNAWDVPAQTITPHAVNTQFWGERVIRYFKRRGHATRDITGQIPIRYRAYVKTGGTVKNYASWTKGTSANGIVAIYPAAPFSNNPAASLATSADPAWVAHEFGHSIVNEVLGEPVGDPTKEVASISEGLSDCFASLILSDSLAELGPQYQSAGKEQAAWKLTYGSFRGDFPETAGFPNLVNPKLTWFGQSLPYTYWAGQQSKTAPFTPPDEEKQKSRYEVNSTLFGGVCKLIVTGGLNPVLSKTVTETGSDPSGDALVPGDPEKSAQYLGELLVETFATAQQFPPTFHDLIDELATQAGLLAQNRWKLPKKQTAEMVRRNFAEYGFGRGNEGDSPHDANLITGNAKPENVIASGLNYFREITGKLCLGEEDFFVLNEEARKGDSVGYEIGLPKGARVEVRLYDEEPCQFDEPTTIKTCALAHQFYPPTNELGQTPTGFDPPPFAQATFPTKTGNRPVYVGLRIKQPSDACTFTYSLTVLLKRGSGSVYP